MHPLDPELVGQFLLYSAWNNCGGSNIYAPQEVDCSSSVTNGKGTLVKSCERHVILSTIQ